MRDALLNTLANLPHLKLTVVDCAAAPAEAANLSARADTIDSLRARPGESALAFMARIAPAFDRIWVIAPESDAILAGLCDCIGPGRWVGCTPEAIRIASSKSATLAHLASHAIPTPLNPDTPHQMQQWVVKPDDGAGAEDTLIFADAARARAWQQAQRNAGRIFTLEPWIDGAPLSLSLACTDTQCSLIGINHQLIATTDGKLSYQGVRANAEALDTPAALELHALARRIHHALPGLRGFVGVDLVRQANGTPVVIEINPRLTCAFEGLPADARMRAIRAALESCANAADEPVLSHPV